MKTVTSFLVAAATVALGFSACPQMADAQGSALLSVTDNVLGQGSQTGVPFNLVVGHSVTLTIAGTPGEAVLLAASTSSPPANPPLIGGVPLAIDPFNFFVLLDGTTNPLGPVVPPNGTFPLWFTVPFALQVGNTFHIQALLAGSPMGVRLTNGLQLAISAEPFATLLQGWMTGHPLGITGGSMLVADAASWSTFWTQHESISFPPTTPPFVDFSQNVVVATFAGTRNTGGYWINIDAIRQGTSGPSVGLIVESTESIPGTGCILPMVITQPFHIVTIPAASVNGPIVAHIVTPSIYTCP